MKIAPEWLGVHPRIIWNRFGIICLSKVTILSIYLIINSPNEKMSLFNLKSHHLVINPGPGPALKCAPGHDSIKDSSIIKSYWLEVGLVHFQNQHT